MEIADFIIALVALVVALMGVPPFLGMMYGKPAIQVSFDESFETNGKYLLCVIRNLPITNRFLKLVGVTSTPTEVLALFDIQEYGTQKIIASAFRARLTNSANHMRGLSLVAKPPFPVAFTLAIHDQNGAHALNYAPSEKKTVDLPPGEYVAAVKIGLDDGTLFKSRTFTVGDIKERTCW